MKRAPPRGFKTGVRKVGTLGPEKFGFVRAFIEAAGCRSVAILCSDVNRDFCGRMASYVRDLGVDAEVYEVVKAAHRDRWVSTVFKASRNYLYAGLLYFVFVVRPLFWLLLRFVQTRVGSEVLDGITGSGAVVWVGVAEDFDVYFLVDSRVPKALRGKHVMLVGYPSRRTAEKLGIPYEEYFSNFMDSLNVPWEEMKRIADRLLEQLRGGSTLRLVAPGGTDLSMRIEPQLIGVFYGVIGSGRLVLNLPAGEVGFASGKRPLDVSGRLYTDVPCLLFDEEVVSGIEVTVERGRLVDYSAERNKRALDEFFKRRSSRRVFELSFGINPAIKPCGSTVLDEKAYGTAHVGFGRPRTPLHADFVVSNPRVYINGRELEL